jgi:uncharacterized protein YbcI
MTTESEAPPSGTEMARHISRGLVNLYKKYAGRGPGFARTYVHEDLIVTVVSDTMTAGEETLKAEDREEMVREQRRVYQDAFRAEAIGLVEGLSGRRVVAFLSDHAIDPDYAAEVFVLASGEDV